MRLLPIVGLFMTVAGLTAADPLAVTLRGGYERYDDRYKVKVSSGGASDTSTHHWESDDAYFVGAYTNILFLKVGLAGFYREREDDQGGADLDYKSYGGRAEGGLSLGLIPTILHVEVMPYVGLGQAQLDYDTALGGDRARDDYTEYGIHGDAVLTITNFELGLGLGYAVSRAKFNEDVGGANVGVRITERVPLIRAFVGVTF